MHGYIMILIFFLFIILGQTARYLSKSAKGFYVLHIAGIFLVVIISLLVSINQSGGVAWPWWIFAMIYIMPILLSLIIGIIQDIANNIIR